MIDFWLAMYSHFEFRRAGRDLPEFQRSLLEIYVDMLLQSRWRPERLCSYLQGSVTFLEEEAEFRVHLWFSLPEGHERYPSADRGLFCLVQPVSREGLFGDILATVSWLGTPLPEACAAPDPTDWVEIMVREQGYVSIPNTSWSTGLEAVGAQQLMAWMLNRHLEGMISRRILEAELEDEEP